MTRSLWVLPVLFLAASPAVGAPAPSAEVKAAFGNTVLTVDPDGRTRKIWLRPDGSWTGLSRRGLDLAGTWTVQGAKVCLHQSKPRLPGAMCNKMPPRVGASLAAKDPSGKTIQLKLVAGHVTE